MEKAKQQAYLMLRPEESVESKKNLLSVEMSLLQIMAKVNAYKKWRKEEVKVRIELKRKLAAMRLDLRKWLSLVPEVEKAKLNLKKKPSEGKDNNEQPKPQPRAEKDAFKKSVEEQLADIKARLRRLG
jgi:hypothetical protein